MGCEPPIEPSGCAPKIRHLATRRYQRADHPSTVGASNRRSGRQPGLRGARLAPSRADQSERAYGMGIGRATSGSAELSALSERISMHAVAYLLAPFRPTDDHRAAFPIVPIGNQIADFVRVKIRRSPHIRLYRSPGSARPGWKGSGLWNRRLPHARTDVLSCVGVAYPPAEWP